MMSRRGLMVSGAAALALPVAGCGGGSSPWDEAAAETWATLAADAGMAELVRYATLAANSHNTQPWRFAATENAVTILPDFARRTPVVESINIDADGTFEFWFTDGDLFWGHVLTVTGDLNRGITDALLQG